MRLSERVRAWDSERNIKGEVKRRTERREREEGKKREVGGNIKTGKETR